MCLDVACVLSTVWVTAAQHPQAREVNRAIPAPERNGRSLQPIFTRNIEMVETAIDRRLVASGVSELLIDCQQSEVELNNMTKSLKIPPARNLESPHRKSR